MVVPRPEPNIISADKGNVLDLFFELMKTHNGTSAEELVELARFFGEDFDEGTCKLDLFLQKLDKLGYAIRKKDDGAALGTGR